MQPMVGITHKSLWTPACPLGRKNLAKVRVALISIGLKRAWNIRGVRRGWMSDCACGRVRRGGDLPKKNDDILLVNIDKLTYAGNLENLKGYEGAPRHVFVHEQNGVDLAVS